MPLQVLFPDLDGQAMDLSGRSMRQLWARIQAKHKAPWPPFSPRQCRAIYADWEVGALAHKVANLPPTQGLQGATYLMNNSVRVVQKHYSPRALSHFAKAAIDAIQQWRQTEEYSIQLANIRRQQLKPPADQRMLEAPRTLGALTGQAPRARGPASTKEEVCRGALTAAAAPVKARAPGSGVHSKEGHPGDSMDSEEAEEGSATEWSSCNGEFSSSSSSEGEEEAGEQGAAADSDDEVVARFVRLVEEEQERQDSDWHEQEEEEEGW
jgi:hypothetical protein